MTLELVEVSPRDGLQNEPTLLSTSDKLRLIGMAIDAGVRRIEVASFVNPKRVPQMADAEGVIDALPRRADVSYIGLVLNERGAERAFSTGIEELGLVCPVTDGFAIANQGMSCLDIQQMCERVIAAAAERERRAQVTLAVAFGCPFDGAVAVGRVAEIARRFARAGAVEIALADTIGIARPHEVSRLVGAVVDVIAPLPVRVHLHDTWGTGVANAAAAAAAGARTLDGAIGGTGGCPFAPGAAGNVPTEGLIYALAPRLGGIDFDLVIDAAIWLNQQLGRSGTSTVTAATLSARRRNMAQASD